MPESLPRAAASYPRRGGAHGKEKPASRSSLSSALRALDLAPRVALGDRLALVVGLLALRDPEQQLGVTAREIELERDDRLALLGHRSLELHDFGAVEQQLAPPGRLQVPAVALLVGRNVELEHPGLAVLDRRVRLGEARLAVAQALHLGAGQHQPRLHGLEDEVVMARTAVLRDHAVGRVGFARHGSAVPGPWCRRAPP